MLKQALITALSASLRHSFPQRALPSNPTRLVVIKPCCLGDVLLTTPTLAALRQRYPQAQIDVVVGSWSRAVLENNPHLNRLLDSGSVGQGRYTLADLLSLAKRLRAERYDLAITLARSPLVGLLPWLAGIRHRLGLDSHQRGFGHTVRVPVPIEPEHEAHIYLRVAAATGLPWPAENPHPFPSIFHPTQADKDSLPPLPSAPFVVLHPAGGVNPGMTMIDKRWPTERFAALAERLAAKGFAVVLTGVASDLPLAEAICQQIDSPAKPLVLAGQLSLGQMGALCQRATLFVGGDTGAMHLAVAVGCQTVAIFGPSDPRRYAPFAPATQAQTVWRPINVPSGGVGQGRVTNFTWAEGASVAEVWRACEALLNAP